MNKWILTCSLHKTDIYLFILVILNCILGSCHLPKTPNQTLTANQSWTKLKPNRSFHIQEKIWLHRTNHPDKFNQYVASYTGFELDVNINETGKYFEVYHAPEKPTGINFSHYLGMHHANQKFFWLDCKNLDPLNAELAINMLDQLDNAYQIKSRIFIESTNPDALKRIRKAGYATVLYLMYPKLNGTQKDTTYLRWLANNWDDQLIGISAEAKYIPILNAYLPNTKKLTWCINPLKNWLLSEKRRMVADSSVLIVLEKR